MLFQDSNIVACVRVKCGENSADIGMLATDPNHQMRGLGKQILNCAEQHALEHFGITTFKMSVLSSRSELIAFYERRGYTRTGEVSSYPASAGIGESIIDGLKVEILVKQVAPLQVKSKIITRGPWDDWTNQGVCNLGIFSMGFRLYGRNATYCHRPDEPGYRHPGK